MSDQDRRIEASTIYSVIAGLLTHSEQISWNRFNLYILFNSMIFIAWTSMYSATNVDCFSLLIMVLISLLGIIGGVAFSCLGYRGRKFVDACLEAGARLENTRIWPTELPAETKIFKRLRNIRDTIPFGFAGSRYILVYGPIVLLVVFLVMMAATLCRIECWLQRII